MKKIILCSLLSFALFNSCKKQEVLIDNKKPEERASEEVIKYTKILTENTSGWKATLNPYGGGSYSFYLNFTKEGKVTMYADLNLNAADKSKESLFRVKALQTATLSFETYNYMHILADPDGGVNGGVHGWGRYSDLEFAFERMEGDSVILIGKFLKSKLTLVKATSSEKTSYESSGLLNSINNLNNFLDENKYPYFTLVDGAKIQVAIDSRERMIKFIWDNGSGTGEIVTTGFSYTLTGIKFIEPLIFKGKSISELTWDAAKKLYYATVDGKKVEILSSSNPLFPLHVVMGVLYTSIDIPYATNYPGWGTDFIERRAVVEALLRPNNVFLTGMRMGFEASNKSITFSPGFVNLGVEYSATHYYTFTITPGGLYKFKENGVSYNAQAIGSMMVALTKERINTDTFTLAYFTHPTTGQLLGQLKSVEHPDFAFTGTLR